ncbi:MAG: ATP-binding protein [Bacteroidota bacterium]
MTYMQPFLQHPLILVFVSINLAVGWWAHRKAKAGSFEDYAMASRSLPSGVLIMTILATIVSDRELSWVDGFLHYGIITFYLSLARYVISMFFIGFIIAPRLVFYEAPTFGGVMKELYGKGAQLLTGIMHCLFSLSLLIPLISSIGIISKELLGMPLTMGVLFFGIMVVLYSTLGGMRSVSYTDVLQLVMILTVLFWVVQRIMAQTGGMVALVREVGDGYPDKLAFLKRPDLWRHIRADFGYGTLSFYLFMSPPLVHRMLMVKDKVKVSQTWYTSPLVYAIIFTMFMIVGLFGIIKNEAWTLAKNKNVFIHLVKNLFESHPRTVDLIALGVIGILLSTMDSLLHTMGITAVKDVFAPIQNLLKKEGIDERRQVNYAKLSVLIIGIAAVVIGSQIDYTSVRYIRQKFVYPLIGLQVIITIPFTLGVMGFKTDKRSFVSFVTTYLSVFYGQKFIFSWSKASKHRVDYDYFLIALPLALVAYFITHIYVNQGIALVKRGKNYTFHRTVTFSWQGIKEAVVGWGKATFNLPEITRQETGRRPAHALVFSIFMFFLYGLGSGAGMSKDDTTINFIMSIYFVGICLCVGLMLQGIWSLRLKFYFPLYWFATLFFTLPLGGTLVFLQSHERLSHIVLFIVSFAFLSYLVSSRAFVWMTFLGVALAWGTWYAMHGHLPAYLWHEVHVWGYIGLAILILFVLFFGNHFENYISQQLYLKKVFGHAVTHEARQPLNKVSIQSGIQEEAVTKLSPIKNEAGELGFFVPEKNAKAIRNGIKEINDALNEVKRDFFHFETLIGKEIAQVPREKVYMKSLFDYIVLTLPKRYTAQVKVRVECKKDFQAMLIRPFFLKVILNLLTNAFKHGLATEMVIEIDGSKRQIRVRDNGKGMPATMLPYIFNFRFSTGDEKNKGVGLAFVKLILDASGIKVETHSRQGEGSFTEFVLTFSED